jgi:hypothetical protein
MLFGSNKGDRMASKFVEVWEVATHKIGACITDFIVADKRDHIVMGGPPHLQQ